MQEYSSNPITYSKGALSEILKKLIWVTTMQTIGLKKSIPNITLPQELP